MNFFQICQRVCSAHNLVNWRRWWWWVYWLRVLTVLELHRNQNLSQNIHSFQRNRIEGTAFCGSIWSGISDLVIHDSEKSHLRVPRPFIWINSLVNEQDASCRYSKCQCSHILLSSSQPSRKCVSLMFGSED